MATPATERQAEQPQGAAARESIARQPDGAAQSGGALAFDVRSVLGLQAAAGNAAVAALLGGGGAPIETRPPPPIPDLSRLSPQDGLARAAALPPGPLLASLGGVAAAIVHGAEREHASLNAAPPVWHTAQDIPAVANGQAPSSEPGPVADGRVAGPITSPPAHEPDSAELQHHHAAFRRALVQEAEAEAHQASRPAGEHAIVASGTSGAIVAAIPERPLSPAPSPIEAAEDEGVSQVAADERGAEIALAVGSGSSATAALTVEHAGKQAEIRTQTARQLSLAEAENRSQRDAERGAAIEQVAGLRRAWGDERGAVLTETSAQGQAAGETARAAIAQRHGEAERAAAAARAQGQREAQKARSPGPGGILGAIGSAAQSVVDRLGQAATAALQGAERLATQALEQGKRLVRATVATAAQAFTAAAARSRSVLAAARDRFRDAIAERVALAKAAVTGLMAGLRTAVKRTLDAAAFARAASIRALEIGWHAALDGVRSVVQGAVQFARNAVQALGAFASIVRDVAANPGQWIANLAAGAQDGIRNHLWPELQQAVREWFDGKVQAVLGLGAAVWGILQRGGITLAQVGHVVWEGIKAAIPPTLISILIEKIVSLIVPAAAAALLIVQAIQAAWGSLSRIIQAFDAFMLFLKSVRWGEAGPLFGKAMAAGAVALIDFVSNFLLQRIGGPIKRVAGKLKGLATRLGGGLKRGVGSARRLGSEVREDAVAFLRRNRDRFRQSKAGETLLAPYLKVKSARMAAELKARGATAPAPIHLTPKEFAQSEDAQIALLTAARKFQAEQDAFGKGLLRDLRINGETSSILKRENAEDFTEGILKKCKRKGYTNIGQMDDIVRGRFNLASRQDVETVVDSLEKQGRLKPRRIDPRPIEGITEGYARYHVVFTDPESGLTHEWQVGTTSVTAIYETPSVTMPPELGLSHGMRANLHDVEYDLLSSIQRDYPGLARKHGISELRRKIALLASEAGKNGERTPELQTRLAPLYEQASKVLGDIVRDKGPAFVRRYFH